MQKLMIFQPPTKDYNAYKYNFKHNLMHWYFDLSLY